MGIAAAGLVLFSSCQKDEAKVYFIGGTAPVLTSSVPDGDTIPLPVTDTTSVAVVYNWTNPDYQFSNGVSSMNVTYYLQVDTSGANFTSPNMQTVAINSDLKKVFTVSQFNAILGERTYSSVSANPIISRCGFNPLFNHSLPHPPLQDP